MTKHPERWMSNLCRIKCEWVEGLGSWPQLFYGCFKKSSPKCVSPPMPYYCMICVQRLKPCYVNRYSLIRISHQNNIMRSLLPGYIYIGYPTVAVFCTNNNIHNIFLHRSDGKQHFVILNLQLQLCDMSKRYIY